MFKHPFQIITTDQALIHFLSFSNAMLAAVRQAHRRIWVMSFVINANLSKQSDPITLFFSILRARRAAGCDIRFILDNPQISRPNYHCNKFFMRHLMEWKIPFCTPPAGVTSHAKAILVDSTVLFIGSHNLAKSSLMNPLDCTVELRNEFLIQSFAETYQMLWSNSTMSFYAPADCPPAKYYG